MSSSPQWKCLYKLYETKDSYELTKVILGRFSIRNDKAEYLRGLHKYLSNKKLLRKGIPKLQF